MITKELKNKCNRRVKTARRSTMQMIKDYRRRFDQSKAMKFAEASEIVHGSQSKMEIVGNGYLFGYMRGSQEDNGQRMVPVYNVPQMSDERWNELAARNKAEREAALC